METKISSKYSQTHFDNYTKIESRMEEILKMGEHLESLIQETFPKSELVYSPSRLESAVSSYFYDITRYKEFHGMLDNEEESKINYPKIFSFMSKWIIKDKPFYIDMKDTDIEGGYSSEEAEQMFIINNSVNEMIVLYWINSTHKYHSGHELIDPNDFDSLIYNFRYREINTGILELLFESKCDPKLVSKEKNI